MNIVNWIKGLFCKKIKKSNYGIIIPHTLKSQGARTASGAQSEYQYAMIMTKIIKTIPYATRDKGGVSGAAYDLFSNHGCLYSIEPHLNAFDQKSEGFELLVMLGDGKSYKEALRIASMFKEEFPDRKLRGQAGVKFIEHGERGFKNLQAARSQGMQVAILSEAFFIDNNNEWIPHERMAKFWKEVLI